MYHPGIYKIYFKLNFHSHQFALFMKDYIHLTACTVLFYLYF